MKYYSGIHYSKIREQERAGTTAPGKNDDKSTNSDDESKRLHKKKSTAIGSAGKLIASTVLIPTQVAIAP